MFTGIIEELGIVKRIESTLATDKDGKSLNSISFEILVSCKFGQDAKIGDSIAINGTCLTIIKKIKESADEGFILTFNVVQETIDRTNLKYIKKNNQVNLEKAMRADSRFDGHIVQGHIEGLGRIKKIDKDKDSFVIRIELPNELSDYCIHKGSIAVNGVSLTIASIKENLIDIWIIPHTLEHTTFNIIKEDDFVNIETDIIAKYVEKLNQVNS